MIELKPCPLCGAKPEIWLSGTGHNNHGQYTARYTINCRTCSIGFSYESLFVLRGGSVVFKENGYDECIKAWNRRVDNGNG